VLTSFAGGAARRCRSFWPIKRESRGDLSGFWCGLTVISQSVYFAKWVLSDLKQDIAADTLHSTCLVIFGCQQVFQLIQRIAALLALRISDSSNFFTHPA
jgi:hypothetical protein